MHTNLNGEIHQRIPVDADGKIALASHRRIRVEGMSLDEIQSRIAQELKTPTQQVQLRVVEYRSRWIYLCGPVTGTEKTIPYIGPETVVEFLRRSGALSWEAEPRDVHVIRSNVAEGRRPEAFPVDMIAILKNGEDRTNIVLQPNDQVYVGEARPSIWAKYLPPWLQFNFKRGASSPPQAGP